MCTKGIKCLASTMTLFGLLLALLLCFNQQAVYAADSNEQYISANAYEVAVADNLKLKTWVWSHKAIWESSDRDIVTVSDKGVVTGIAPGTATVTATYDSAWNKGANKQKCFEITVKENTSSTINNDQHVMVGESIKINVRGHKVLWKSSDNSIAKVSRKGIVTGVTVGEAIITADYHIGFWFWRSHKTEKFNVVVDEKEPVKYTVIFNSNGGSEVESQIIEEGQAANEPESPKKENSIFAGWYVDDAFSVLFKFLDNTVTDNITLYARWIDLADETDNDNDSIPDSLEDLFGTDSSNNDTDNDGLSDYIEINNLGLDPLNEDTDKDGITDGEEDKDSDGLINIKEIECGTNPAIEDTDDDALSDYDEIVIHKTDAVIVDTDNDGVSDGKEIELGTDPLLYQTNFDIQIASDDSDVFRASVEINLTGEQVETLSINPVENNTLFPNDIPGYIGNAYDFNVEGDFDKAIIKFEFDSQLMDDDFDPVIYFFNEKKQKLEELETKINDNVASTVVNHFSTYLLINRKVFQQSFEWIDVWDSNDYTGTEVVLVIDDSGSMDSNDSMNQRLTVSQNLIDKLPDNSKIGVVKFSNSTILLTESLTSDRELAKSYLSSSYFKSSGGTYMYGGIESAISLFETNDDNILKTIILLSDGATTDSSKHASVISLANSANIKLYSIGLGNSETYFEKYLKPLAENTGGEFYLAKNADSLSDIYSDINTKIDIETDSDGDGIPDYYEEHMLVFNGVKLVLDKNNPDSDGDGLLDGEEVILEYQYNEDKTKVIVIGRLIANPLVVDADGDGLYDNAERVVKIDAEDVRTVAPKDPEPLRYNGYKGMWNYHVLQQENSSVPTQYSDKEYELELSVSDQMSEVIVKEILKYLKDPFNNHEEIIRPVALIIKYYCRSDIHSSVGAYLLNFIYDEYEFAYHSQPDTWQRSFGYNVFYDDVFRIGSYMDRWPIFFSDNEDIYALWMWKGDYWNLFTGAEIGLYKFKGTYSGTNHYDSIDFELKMTLSLYNYYSNNNIENVFNWAPKEPQWWITGFNTNFKEPWPDDMISIGTIDFSEHTELFNSLQQHVKAAYPNDNTFIFDSNTLWIQWKYNTELGAGQ